MSMLPRITEPVRIDPNPVIVPRPLPDPYTGAWGWGNNRYGQAGSAVAAADHLRPVQASVGRFSAVAGGAYHTLALDQLGKVCAWGNNSWGELGDGSGASQSTTPVAVANLTGVRAIAAGASHGLALCTSSPTAPGGTVWAWGLNGHGQLGDGTEKEKFTPVQLRDLTTVVAIAACENHSLALTADGMVWAWGANDRGQLGDGTISHHRSFPRPVKTANGTGALTGVKAIAAGGSFSLAVAGNKVWAWGGNSFGELGDSTYHNRSLPVQVMLPAGRGPLDGVKSVAASTAHSLALRTDGTVFAWGANGNGTLGDGTTEKKNVAVQVVTGAARQPLQGISAIAAGQSFSLALGAADGRVWSWGMGALGDNIGALRTFPTQVMHPTWNSLLTGMTAIAAGKFHGLAVGTVPS